MISLLPIAILGSGYSLLDASVSSTSSEQSTLSAQEREHTVILLLTHVEESIENAANIKDLQLISAKLSEA